MRFSGWGFGDSPVFQVARQVSKWVVFSTVLGEPPAEYRLERASVLILGEKYKKKEGG